MSILKEAFLSVQEKRDPELKRMANFLNAECSLKAKVSYGTVTWRVKGDLKDAEKCVEKAFGKKVASDIKFIGKDSFEVDLGEFSLDVYVYKGYIEGQVMRNKK